MKQKILIADDDQSIVEVITVILLEKGYEVLSFDNSHDVMYHAKHDKPQLILIDLWMSGVDGAEITHALKKDNVTKDIPIIIVSAKNDIKNIAKEIGADGFLPKPFDIDDLATIVAKYVKKG